MWGGVSCKATSLKKTADDDVLTAAIKKKTEDEIVISYFKCVATAVELNPLNGFFFLASGLCDMVNHGYFDATILIYCITI